MKKTHTVSSDKPKGNNVLFFLFLKINQGIASIFPWTV
jgi:hypothetical protein